MPDKPDPSAVVEPDLGASSVGEVVGRERLAAEMIDLVGRLHGFLCSTRRLVFRFGEPIGPALQNPELATWRLAPDRRRDRPDLALVQRRSALQTVGLDERSEDDRR